MPTLDFTTGFEHRVVAVSAAATSAPLLWTEVGTTQAISTATFRSGSASLQINPSNATGYVSHPLAAPTRVIGIVYVHFGSLPTGADCRICSTYTDAGGQIIGVDTNGKWYAESAGGAGGSRQTAADGPSTGTWYRIDFDSNSGGTSHTLIWSVNGVAKTTATATGQASDTQDSIRFGTTTATTVNMFIDDCAISVTAGDYPIGGTYVLGYLPNADGTHSNQANFQDAGNAAISGTNPAYDQMDAVPLSSRTEYITQTANGTGDYVEVAFPNSSETAPIRAVQVTCAASADSATGNNAGYVLRDGSSDGTVYNGDPSQTTDIFLSLCFATKPSTGAWTDAAFDALIFRFGYSSDANPDPHCGGTILEAAYAEPGVYNESISLGAGGGVAIARQTQQRPTMALGVGAGGSFGAGKLVQGGFTLGAGGGMSPSASQGYPAALSLGAGLGLSSAARADFRPVLSLGAGMSYTPAAAANLSRAFALGASAGIASREAITLVNDWVQGLTTGENSPHGMTFAEGYIWIGLQTSPGKLIRMDPADHANYDVVTFDNDGNHDQIQDLCYIPAKGKIYCLFRESARCVVAEVDPQTLAVTTVINDTTSPCAVFGGSFHFDATYLYVLTYNDSPSYVIRYQLSDWARISAMQVNASSTYTYGHVLRHDGSNLYAAGVVNASPYTHRWVVRIDPSSFTVADTADLTLGAAYNITDDACFTANYAWFGLEGLGHHVLKIDKSNLSSYALIDVYSGCYGTYADGPYVLALLYGSEYGHLARIFPADSSVRFYQFPSGQLAPNEFCRGGEQVYVTLYTSPGSVSAFSRSEYGAFAPALTLGAQGGVASVPLLNAQAQFTLSAALGIAASAGANTFNESIAFAATAGFGNAAKADLLAAFAFGVAASYANQAGLTLAGVLNLAASLNISAAATIAAAGSLALGASAALGVAARTDFYPAVSLNSALGLALARQADLQAQTALGAALGLGLTPGARYYNAMTAGAALSIAAASANEFFATVQLAASLGLTPVPQLAAQAALSAGAVAGLSAAARADFAGFLTLAASLGISASLAQNIYQVTMSLGASLGYAPASSADFRPVASLGVAASVATAPQLQIPASFTLGLGAAMAAAGRMDYQGYLQLGAALGIAATLAEQIYYEAMALGASMGNAVSAQAVLGAAAGFGAVQGLTITPSVVIAAALAFSSSMGLSAGRYLSFADALALGLAGGMALAPRLDAQPVLALGAAAGLSAAAQADFQDAMLLAMQAGCSSVAFASFVRTFTLAASLGLDAYSIAGILPTPTDYLDAAYSVAESLSAAYGVGENLRAYFGPDDRLEAWF